MSKGNECCPKIKKLWQKMCLGAGNRTRVLSFHGQAFYTYTTAAALSYLLKINSENQSFLIQSKKKLAW